MTRPRATSVAVAALSALPWVLFGVLSALRPDVMGLALTDPAGRLALGAALLLDGALAGALLLLLRLVKPSRSRTRGAVAALAAAAIFVVLGGPALALVFFAPIVTAVAHAGDFDGRDPAPAPLLRPYAPAPSPLAEFDATAAARREQATAEGAVSPASPGRHR